MVQCEVCHLAFDCSARSGRDIKAGRVQPRCVLHRRRRRKGTVTATMRRYWLDRFTMDEIREMAEAFWPLPSQRAAVRDAARLTASANDD